MKNLVSIMAVILLTVFTITGCHKELDTKPQDQLTELVNFGDIQNALRGCYDGFQSTNYYNNTSNSGTPSGWSGLPDLMGDDFVESLESLGNWNEMSEMVFAADNTIVQGLFRQPYEIISRANNLLQSISKFETGTTAAEAKRIKAQALAIRAHAHFDLMRYFAQDFARNSTSLGVPYVTSFDPAAALTTFPARKTVKENYDAIYADLTAALAAFREGGNTTGNTNRMFIDSTVVYAIRARVNYYAAQWADVITDATIAMNNRPITNTAGFTAMYTAATEAAPVTEVYWAIPSDNSLRPGGSTSGTSASYRVTAAMSSVIQSMGGAYVNTNITRFNQAGVGGVLKTVCWKYPGIRSFKVYRAAEMLLMRAEAKYRTGDVTALVDLNQLRTNRGVTPGIETGTALLDAILLTRRVELLGEGHRWFDIKRTTKTIVRAECGGGTSSTSRARNCTIAPTARGWVFPIPFNDMKVNPNLVQNNGY